jgi:hypothetical protein
MSNQVHSLDRESGTREPVQPTPEELSAKVEDMVERGTFLGSMWSNGDTLTDSTALLTPYAYSVSSGWRTVKYNRWYSRGHAPTGPRHHTDVDEMLLPVFVSSVADGNLKLQSEGMPGPDKFGISGL